MIEFLYKFHNEIPVIDFSSVKQDEKLMSLGRFYGFDNITGQDTFFEINSPNLRESVISKNSRCTNRVRQLVIALAKLNNEQETSSLEYLLQKHYLDKRILLLESHSPFASIFKHYCNKYNIELYATEYLSFTASSGEIINETLHVDIQNTHFPEEYFDLIVHTDVFEHVPDALLGEKEVARILKVGGAVIFTVPFDHDGSEDSLYAELKNNEILYYKPPVYHEDPVSESGKCLVFRIFSLPEMWSRYKANGLDLYSIYVHSRYMGVLGNDGFSFTGVKKWKVE
ncbi:hypothetical protein TH61_12715 [Rufibacter sp. DG15C]|uniref:class I SAM-dependent methyltransferase n=1 Tax=Rufibacter sp. DG15C TaxID=1379909 RepID=UPI00078BA371|nr:methyltransferase domain-containing protein [Rufibacter sp. DG15C]AMM51865.1 hypothetical protein TH61_12715 [Rufibacter sp. DG15C]